MLFAATAFGLVLPGVLLPQLLLRWSLNDRQAGLLLFLSFVGSSLGAVSARGRLVRTIALGGICVAVGLAGLSFAGPRSCFAAMALLGFGLGLAMTSISLMQSRQHAAHRSAELSRLNLIWSLGACASPSLLLRGVARWSLSIVLLGSAAIFLLLGLACALLLEELPAAPVEVPAEAPDTARRSASPSAAALTLLVIIAMATGVEASLGGWLTTYSRRSGLMAAGVAEAITCLWAGLLLGRLVQSFQRVARWGERRVLALAPWLLCAALAGLLGLHLGWTMSVCALLAGFALGPTYPLSLALWLEQGERGNLAFLVAGAGSAALPLLTGILSDATHSLARGLLVPFAGACLMAAAATARFARPQSASRAA